jgi:antitoxin MazE
LTARVVSAILGIARGESRMVTRIQKWGNSQGLRISRQLLADAHIAVGDEVDVAVQDGRIVIAPARQVRGKHSLQALVEAIPNDYRVQEVDWGKPLGKEAW